MLHAIVLGVFSEAEFGAKAISTIKPLTSRSKAYEGALLLRAGSRLFNPTQARS